TTNYVVEFVRELADEGKTVVFSAHNLYHVERVCDRVVIMNEGDIVARGTVEEIRDEHGGVEYTVETTVEVEGATEEDGGYRTTVEDMDGVERVREEARENGGEVVDIRTREPSLEDIFLDVAEAT
ncbi:MAG: ABC-2 type transport system ATP-binding protein, partial [Methanobacteriota archaeon]